MRLFAATLLTLAACGSGAAERHTAPDPEIYIAMTALQVDETELPAATVPAVVTTTTTVPAYQPAANAKCPEWHETALEAGWQEEELERLDLVLWRESRCLPEAFNPQDPNGGSRGLSQVNQFWCKPTRYFPLGWLQTQGVLGACGELHDPVVNLTAARAIYEYAAARGCGWSPWSTRSARWC